MRTIPKGLLTRITAVTAKRARTVLDHMLKHGQVTSQELRDLYGYNHPPRAVRDVREYGIPVETFRVVGTDGRKIAAYRIAAEKGKGRTERGGRRPLPASLRRDLVSRDGFRCHICGVELPPRYLQVDHRVPYEVGGDRWDPERHVGDFMLLCSSCNRAKSWSCEHCQNWLLGRKVRVCSSCYWARPERYDHVAMVPERRVTLVWSGAEGVHVYERLATLARCRGIALQSLLMDTMSASVAEDADTTGREPSASGV